MNLFHSDKTYEDLLQDMQKDGYSQNYMKCVRREIRWLENHQNIYHFASFEAACQIRVAQTSSPETQAMILSRLVDTFSSRILYPMLLLSGNHSSAAVLSWEEDLH